MSTTASTNRWDPAETTRVWQAVSECLENFVKAWESTGSPPAIGDFATQPDKAVRRLALIELIKVDLEYRAQHDQTTRSVEDYLAEFPEIADDGLPLDLIYEEFHLRRRGGEDVAAEDYCRRFPARAEELRRMLESNAPHVSTTLFTGEAVAAIDVNDHIDDFDILAQLGKGAFATVFLARQRSMQRIVALKVSADRGTEPQMLAQLDHPHIVRVFDQRILADRGLRLLYMQYVPGGTLQAVVDAVRACPRAERTGKLLLNAVDRALEAAGQSPPNDSTIRRRLARASWPEAVCWIGARLAAALEYAHRHGVLHRDIKPANVLMAADGSPKLVDFNIACCSKVEGAGPAAYFGGSLAYMSPEQLEACNPAHERKPDDLDARAEVYSLGVVLWELLCGRRPFPDEAVQTSWPRLLGEMAARRRRELDPQMIGQLPTDLPPGLRDVLCTCLAPDPQRRFASAGELARQLELCLRPSAQRLLRPARRSWRNWVCRHPTLALAAGAIGPNALLSALNISYNVPSLIEKNLAAQSAKDFFWNVQIPAMNGSLYPAALLAGVSLCWPVLRVLRRGEKAPAEVRRRSLSMGDYIFWVTLAAWSLSGIIYPVWLKAETGKSFGGPFYYHFFASQFLFGLLAGTLAFFVDTYLTVHALHPALLRQASGEERDLQWLAGLSARVWRYFGVSVAVPFLAVAVLAGTALWVDAAEQTAAFAVTGLLGLVGFFVSFGLSRAIQADIVALGIALSPAGETLPGETQTFDPFTASNLA
jgi:serine/threonine protein kinase